MHCLSSGLNGKFSFHYLDNIEIKTKIEIIGLVDDIFNA